MRVWHWGWLSLALVACPKSESNTVSAPEIDAAVISQDGGVDRDGADSVYDASNDVAVDAAPFVPAYFDLNHVLGTGQSLSVGAQGAPVLSSTQPYENKMFVTGAIAGGTGLTSFVPLVETSVETLSSAFANRVTSAGAHRMLISGHGVGGIAYSGLKKGTTPYANGLAQVTAAKSLAAAQGLSYVVRGVTNVHGESDHVAQNPLYEQNLVTWQNDYETDVKRITGQTEPVPMFHTQMSSWTKYGQATSAIPAAQLAASVNSAGKIVMVGPKYSFSYAPDGVHLTNAGYRHMGEYYAKVYRSVVLEGQRWEPLRPTSVVRTGSQIRVVFHVPVPPLVFDTTLVSAIAANGFEYTDASASPPAITSVALDGADAVKITLATTPTGANQRIRYAYTGTVNARGGPTSGPRGNLRDSDASTSLYGNALYNWAVHFDVAVP